MKQLNILIILVLLGVIGILVAQQAGVLPPVLSSKAGPDAAAGLSAAAANPPAGQNVPAAVPKALEQDFVKQLVDNITPEQRQTLLGDAQVFRQFIDQEALNISLLQAASAGDLPSDPATRLLVQRGSDNVLREIYLTRLVNSKIPADYPNEEQIKEYYDANKDNLKLVERVAVWQIFLPVDASLDAAAAASVAKEADRIATEVRAGKRPFTAAAAEYSRHEPSRLNGGFMGIIKTSDLIPEVHKVITALKAGEVSAAIKSTMGYHILRKGDVLPVRDLSIDEVRDEIRNLLLNQARTQLRNAINTEVLKQYPVSVDEATAEVWRQALLSQGQ